MLKIREMNRSLEEIEKNINNLFHLTVLGGHEHDITAELIQMRLATCELQLRLVTCELQRSLVTPSIIEGYRLDVIQQMRRVGELIAEMGPDPDDQKLLAISMAEELAIEKIRELKGMTCMREKLAASTQVNHGLARAAA